MDNSRVILLTGFAAFGDVVDNPTERLVRHFETRGLPGHSLAVCVLPVSYQRAPGLLVEAIRRGDARGRPFDTVWMLGVAAGSPHWRVERFGRNRNNGKPDAEDFQPAERIVEAGVDILEATAPVESLLTALRDANLPAVASDSAGGYLCNHALYTALAYLTDCGDGISVGFLHVPADPDTMAPGAPRAQSFAFEQHILAVEVTLSVLTKR